MNELASESMSQDDRERRPGACEGEFVRGACGANRSTQGDRERRHGACEGAS